MSNLNYKLEPFKYLKKPICKYTTKYYPQFLLYGQQYSNNDKNLEIGK